MTNYLAENGCRIPFIGELFINGSIKILGIPAEAWGRGFPFIESLQAPTVTSGWGDANTCNQNWGVSPGVP